MLCSPVQAAAAAASQAAAHRKAAVGGPWLELSQLTVKAALQASSQGSLRASEKSVLCRRMQLRPAEGWTACAPAAGSLSLEGML